MRSILWFGFTLSIVVALLAGVHVREAVSDCPVNIQNIQKSFDGEACEVTISWETGRSTSTNFVDWGTSGCVSPSYPNTVYSYTTGTSHSVTIDVSGISTEKINFQITSSTGCGSETTGCLVSIASPCSPF